MEQNLAKSLRRAFTQQLAEELPQFEPQGGAGKVDFPGWRSFIWSVAEDLHFFVCLCLDPSSNGFFVEGGWGPRPEYPDLEKIYTLRRPGKDPAGKEEILVRTTGPESDVTWTVETEPAVHGATAEAIQAIHREFLPLFAKRAQTKGIDLTV